MENEFFKKIFSVCTALALPVSGYGSLVFAENFSVCKGESLFLFNKKDGPCVFESSDTNVADVKNYVVFAKNEGKCTIIAKPCPDGENEQEKVYEIEVSPEKKVKRVAYINSEGNLSIYAITSPEVNDLEIEIEKKKCTIKNKNKTKSGKNLFWKVELSTENIKSIDSTCKIFGLTKGKGERRGSGEFKLKFFDNPKENGNGEVFEKNISENGAKFIMDWEGFVPDLVEDRLVPGVYNIGNGDVINFGETFYNHITKEQAFVDMVSKLNSKDYVKDVNSFLKENKIKCTQQQFDALVSFSYNLGTGWLKNSELKNVLLDSFEPGKNTRNLNFVDKEKLIKEVLIKHHVINSGKKICILGLLYRRISELNLFLHNEYSKEAGRKNEHGYEVSECIMETYEKKNKANVVQRRS